MKRRAVSLQQQILTSCVTLFQCRLLTADRSEKRRKTIVAQATANTNTVMRDCDGFYLSAGGRPYASGTIHAV